MIYNNIKEGTFLSRPNRFIAYVRLDGKEEICHVKNTGRLGELLKKGAKVYLQESENPERKTKYDMVAVYKDNMLVNIDSQAPNKVFGEWAEKSGFFGDITFLKPECKYKNSRFDFYIETEKKKIFVEVKGVTLEENGVLKFPDAPTQRGVKHINELCECVKDGYEAYVFFIIQMEQANYFTPNRLTHPEFADVLLAASECGVHVKSLCCRVEKNLLIADKFIEVKL